MVRYLFLGILLVTGSFPSYAMGDKYSPATYILQLSSNLKCDTINIELIARSDDNVQYLRYSKSAYAAANVPAGTYAFGNVICTTEGGRENFDMLIGKIAEFTLSSGQVYYGGRMIFEEVDNVGTNDAPDVLNNCTNVNSRARGEKDNRCRDGIGVDTKSQTAKQIRVYAPDVTDEDISSIRTALSASENQLRYLPLKLSKPAS